MGPGARFGPSDLVGKRKSRPTAYDELAELATMSALAKWLQRWQPIAIHSAVLAGARMEGITGALENGKPGITEEEYEAVVWRFAAIGIKVGTSAAMSSRPGRLRLPIDGAGRRRRAD
jgi:hypothetical protein